MRTSQRALLAALSTIVLVMIAVTAWVRFGASAELALTGARASLSPALAGFDAIAASGQWRLTVTRADDWRVELDVPAELEPYVDARVVDGRLELGLKPGIRLRGGGDRAELIAKITLPGLSSLVLSGAARLDFTGFEGEQLTVGASGASKIMGSASRFDSLALTLSGAVAADLRDVTVTDADVRASGASRINLRMAGGRLTGGISGAGRLEYSGTIREQSVSASGAVKIEHVE